MKIITIIPDVDPAQVAELMDLMRRALYREAGWMQGNEFVMGIVDDDCKPMEVE